MNMHIALQPMQEKDLDALCTLVVNEEIKKTYMLPDFEDRQAAEGMARRLMALSLEETHFVRGIYADSALAGFLNDVEVDSGRIEIGYVVHPDHWNKGVATAAVKLAIDALFEKGFHTVRAAHFTENPASGRVMQKAGMHRIAYEDDFEYRGSWHHCIFYEITK